MKDRVRLHVGRRYQVQAPIKIAKSRDYIGRKFVFEVVGSTTFVIGDVPKPFTLDRVELILTTRSKQHLRIIREWDEIWRYVADVGFIQEPPDHTFIIPSSPVWEWDWKGTRKDSLHSLEDRLSHLGMGSKISSLIVSSTPGGCIATTNPDLIKTVMDVFDSNGYRFTPPIRGNKYIQPLFSVFQELNLAIVERHTK
jgi:hypothetical protein